MAHKRLLFEGSDYGLLLPQEFFPPRPLPASILARVRADGTIRPKSPDLRPKPEESDGGNGEGKDKGFDNEFMKAALVLFEQVDARLRELEHINITTVLIPEGRDGKRWALAMDGEETLKGHVAATKGVKNHGRGSSHIPIGATSIMATVREGVGDAGCVCTHARYNNVHRHFEGAATVVRLHGDTVGRCR